MIEAAKPNSLPFAQNADELLTVGTSSVNLAQAMQALIRSLFRLLCHLGAVGLLNPWCARFLFFFLPFGNDILLVVLVARSHENFLLYLLTAAAGSTIGVLLLDLVIRRGGAEGLKRLMNEKRANYLEKKMKQ